MSSKSIEELLAILESSQDVERLPTDVEQFIKDYELSSSEERVKASHIYWTYLNWKEKGNGREEVLTKCTFFKNFKKFFKVGRIGKHRFYFVTGEYVRVSRGEEKKLAEDVKLERQHRQWLKQRKEKKGTQ